MRKIIDSIIIGISITALFSILPNSMEVGSWGHPLGWLKDVDTSDGQSKEVIWLSLIIDLFIWIIVAYGILLIIFRGGEGYMDIGQKLIRKLLSKVNIIVRLYLLMNFI